jgi:hypothetical protein
MLCQCAVDPTHVWIDSDAGTVTYEAQYVHAFTFDIDTDRF